ncbi:MAG: methenyltetrahydromethanopterin cyclohydrolase [Burkholderiaceae bacterium]|nr:methenyltetrahydromethanopterin cyclohydrolase [Burkholderiaceae bacterium]
MRPHRAALDGCRLSVNQHVAPWVERLCAHADALRVHVQRDDSGVRVVDAGIAAPGGVAAGLLIGEICMGGFGRVTLRSGASDGWPSGLGVHSSLPVLACLASQYAGWSLAASKEETGGKKFFALGSGPVRALALKEPLFAELGYRDHAAQGVLVLEVDRVPPPVVLHKVLRDTGLPPEALTVVLTPTTSAAGTTQVVARVLEVALHKAHELGFALADIVDGAASAPLPAPSPDGVQAMGRTNDAILYGGRVHLSVRGSDDAAQQLAAKLPSMNSRDFGRSFAYVFKDVGYDFYKIDPALFAPAEVWVSNLDSGRTWHAGMVNMDLLRGLWLEEA